MGEGSFALQINKRYNRGRMLSRRFRPLFTAALLFAFSASMALFAQDTTHRGRKYKAPPPTSKVEVTILRGDDGKPIENAAVVFQQIGRAHV